MKVLFGNRLLFTIRITFFLTRKFLHQLHAHSADRVYTLYYIVGNMGSCGLWSTANI